MKKYNYFIKEATRRMINVRYNDFIKGYDFIYMINLLDEKYALQKSLTFREIEGYSFGDASFHLSFFDNMQEEWTEFLRGKKLI